MIHLSSASSDGETPWDSLGRLFAGEATGDDEIRLERWLAAEPARQRLIADLRTIWEAAEPGRPSRDPEQVLAAIRERDASPVGVIAPSLQLVVPPTPVRRLRRRVLAAAAVASFAVGGWWMARPGGPLNDHPVAAASKLVEHRTKRGQRLALTLPDGSTVLLGPESSLRYAVAYGDVGRTVELAGDGYFNVIHDETKPFVVRAGKAIARDIGTRFIVRARDGEYGGAVDVAVTEGRVALSGAGQALSHAVLLDARDLGRVDSAGSATAHRGVSLDAYVGWTEGRLAFEATPLSVVVAELSRWYDVDVRLDGVALGTRQLTAEFNGEPLSKVLAMVQASLGVQLRVAGRQYILSAH